jgi:uncharacterized protein (DUF488 family)
VAARPDSSRLWTIGHGKRSSDDFVQLLLHAQIETVIDVRAYPVSRRHPQFSRPPLASALAGAGIDYVWEGAALGGRREPHAQSPHTALKEDVRGFADHMASPAFTLALERVTALAATQRAAIMCAETLAANCHRSLIADALTLRGVTVLHLVDRTHPAPHKLNMLARVRDGRLVYDGGASQLPLL